MYEELAFLKIKHLFQGHPDLINDFLMFLPHENRAETSQLLPPSQAPVLFQPPQSFVQYPSIPVVPVSSLQQPGKPVSRPGGSSVGRGVSGAADQSMEQIRSSGGESNFRHFLRICKLLGDVVFLCSVESRK